MKAPAPRVNESRVWSRLMHLGEIGRFGRTGVDRQAFTDGDLEAKRFVVDWGRKQGFAVETDAIGNLFVRRPGSDPGAIPLVVGSHLDTEPTGGRFDGAYGVVAAMEILDLLEENGIATKHPVELVAWANEEGCRFQPGCMGSLAYVDPSVLDLMLFAPAADGLSVAEAMADHELAFANLGRRSLGQPFLAFFEAHIEQGPLLDKVALPAAAVSGIQGRIVFDVEVDGRTGHAGTVPHHLREDALERAVGFLHGLYRLAASDEQMRLTVGNLVVEPGSPSVIPGRVQFTIDVRHPNRRTLETFPGVLTGLSNSHPAIRINQSSKVDPVVFDAALTELVEQKVTAMTGRSLTLVSGAMHDARHLADFCPTTMVFVRCKDGVSHHEDEYASSEDLAVGAQALLGCVLALTASQAPFHNNEYP